METFGRYSGISDVTDAQRLALDLTNYKPPLLVETTDNGTWKWLGGSVWVQTHSGGAALIRNLGFVNQKHDRRIDSVTDTWPGNDTFSCAFTQDENVRRYRWHFVTNSGTVTHVKVAEDSVNEAQAEAWLADSSASATSDAMNRRLYTEKVWSEWIELSKDSRDLSLSRLDFLAAGTTPDVDIFVEAE